jgi:hypothetical protein
MGVISTKNGRKGPQSRPGSTLVARAGLVLFMVAVLFTLAHADPPKKDDDDDDRPGTSQDGGAGEKPVKLDAAAQTQGRIETMAATPVRFKQRQRAFATVLDIAPLIDLATRLAAERSALAGVEARLKASDAAAQRTGSLYRQGQSLSAAQAEAADAALKSEQAERDGARSAVKLIEATARNEWGPVLGQAIVTGAPLFTHLIDHETVLIQITTLDGAVLARPPKSATIRLPRQAAIEAELISPAARIDPRIQGTSLLYTAPPKPGVLTPGVALTAWVETGLSDEAVRVPEAAVVRWQGESWVYVRISDTSFQRRRISTEMAEPDGYYDVTDLPDDAVLVIKGASLLLSQEFRSSNTGGDDD